MTREDYENEKCRAIEDLQSAAEAIESGASVYYNAGDDLESITEKAEGDVELIESYVQEFKEKIRELKELKRTEFEIEEEY